MERSNFEEFVDWMETKHNREFHVLLKRIEEWLHSPKETTKKEPDRESIRSVKEKTLRERISDIHERVRTDPEIIKRKRERAKRLSTLSQEQLDRRVRGSEGTTNV